jgi:type I restriction enzyme R subunit
MTSFKSAQLIANSKDADKVLFLMDRIELGTQSLLAYQGFADDNEDVQATENTHVLVGKLKSNDPANTLVVTSIQKMSNINNEDGGLKAHDIDLMNNKRIVFIVDEAHRSTFGDMLIHIKETFPSAMFFGFTGTPIQEENQRNMNTTATVFGDELHRYSIADGIRDKNVLGFDPYKILTYKDKDLRKAVALEKAKAKDEVEALSDPNKKEIFLKFMQHQMAGSINNGKYAKGIEDYLPKVQYETKKHKEKVVEDIVDNWMTLSQGSKFHAIFATSSIHEAIEYYQLIKAAKPDLRISALFDPNIDNNGGVTFKLNGLVEIIEDYNKRYNQDFSFATHAKFKKDIANRLAHKKTYLKIENEPEKQLDLLIVVDQMLTGFDSKWVNTLYLDKKLAYHNIIQAFSRTNRLFGPDKPFGTIRYYRFPHTMDKNIIEAVKLYSGDKPFALFALRLPENLKKMNAVYDDISDLFNNAGIKNFEKLPDDNSERGKFAKLFKAFNDYLEAAKIQGFKWDKSIYTFGQGKEKQKIELKIVESIYLVLALRYKELTSGGGGQGYSDVPYEIDSYLTEIDTDKIDSDYMNSRFQKFLKVLKQEGADTDMIQQTLDELHKSFPSLTQEEQKFANIFIHDVESGTVNIEESKTFRDYITEYQFNAKNNEIYKVSQSFGLNEDKLRKMMNSGITESNINEYGRFDDLKKSVVEEKAAEYFAAKDGKTVSPFQANMKTHNLLKDFIIKGELGE